MGTSRGLENECAAEGLINSGTSIPYSRVKTKHKLNFPESSAKWYTWRVTQPPKWSMIFGSGLGGLGGQKGGWQQKKIPVGREKRPRLTGPRCSSPVDDSRGLSARPTPGAGEGWANAQ